MQHCIILRCYCNIYDADTQRVNDRAETRVSSRDDLSFDNFRVTSIRVNYTEKKFVKLTKPLSTKLLFC